jgi:hypothetical protein
MSEGRRWLKIETQKGGRPKMAKDGRKLQNGLRVELPATASAQEF